LPETCWKRGKDDKRYLVMSSAAIKSPNKANRVEEKHATILSSSLDTIEACGGGRLGAWQSFR
jgi:hypothetical protein